MTWYDAEGRPLARSFRENPNFFVAPPKFSLKCYAAVFDIDDLKIEEDDDHNLTLICFTLVHRHKEHKQ